MAETEKRKPPLSAGRDILDELNERFGRGGMSTNARVWLANRITKAVAAPYPDTPPPSGDVPKGTSGEIEGLVDRLVEMAILTGRAEMMAERNRFDLLHKVHVSAVTACEHRLGDARTALLSRITSPSSENTSGRDPSGPDCRPSDRTPTGFDASGASISRAKLLALAEQQVAYWRDRQTRERCQEDCISEDGMTYTPMGDDAALSAGRVNGWYSSSDWWLKTISNLPGQPLDDRDLCNCRIGQCRELTEKCREDQR